MSLEILVFDSQDQFKITSVERNVDTAFIYMEGQTKSSICPYCSAASSAVHSRYLRTIKNLPAFGNKVCLRLNTRKFYCSNQDCDRKLFAERFDGHFARYKRITDRLRGKLLKIALLTGGNAGEKLCKTLNILVSSSTL